MNERAFSLISLAYKIICAGSIVVWLVWLNANGYWQVAPRSPIGSSTGGGAVRATGVRLR